MPQHDVSGEVGFPSQRLQHVGKLEFKSYGGIIKAHSGGTSAADEQWRSVDAMPLDGGETETTGVTDRFDEKCSAGAIRIDDANSVPLAITQAGESCGDMGPTRILTSRPAARSKE